MLLVAVVLVVLLGIAHSYLGERFLLMRLFKRDNLPKLLGGDAFTKGTLRFAWHLTSVAWFGLAAMLFSVHMSGKIEADFALYTISAVSVVSALFAASFTRGRHLSWIVFLAVAAITAFSAMA